MYQYYQFTRVTLSEHVAISFSLSSREPLKLRSYLRAPYLLLLLLTFNRFSATCQSPTKILRNYFLRGRRTDSSFPSKRDSFVKRIASFPPRVNIRLTTLSPDNSLHHSYLHTRSEITGTARRYIYIYIYIRYVQIRSEARGRTGSKQSEMCRVLAINAADRTSTLLSWRVGRSFGRSKVETRGLKRCMLALLARLQHIGNRTA